jgi:hypothetical protein
MLSLEDQTMRQGNSEIFADYKIGIPDLFVQILQKRFL